jgi:hypothetical protein
MTSTPFNRPKLSRHRPDDEKKHIEQYVTAVGRVLWEWNAAHASLFFAFWGLIGDGGKRPRDKPSSLWHAMQTDDAQRKLLRSFAGPCLFQRPGLLSKLTWALDRLDAIAPFCNIAAHLPQEFRQFGDEKARAIPIHSVRRAHALKFVFVEGKHRLSFWNDVADDLYVLDLYIQWLGFEISGHANAPMPYKRQLRSIAKIREANAWVEGVVNKKRRKGRRRSQPKK